MHTCTQPLCTQNCTLYTQSGHLYTIVTSLFSKWSMYNPTHTHTYTHVHKLIMTDPVDPDGVELSFFLY